MKGVVGVVVITFVALASAEGRPGRSGLQGELPRWLQPRKRDPRAPLNVIPPSLVANHSKVADLLSSRSVGPCASQHDVYNGDAYKVVGAQPSGCKWHFDIQPSVDVDIVCPYFYVPCGQGFFDLEFDFFGDIYRDGFCCYDVLENVIISITNFDFEYGLTLSGSVGIYECTVRGSGGTQRPSDPDTDGPPESTENGPSKNTECGQNRYSDPSKGKIVGGTVARENEYPWMAALFTATYNFCGGSLINDRWILTAAHCINGLNDNEVVAAVGCNDLYNCNNFVYSDKIINHPSYDGYVGNDIALIRLERSVPVDGFSIYPICLPSCPVPTPNYDLNVAGWGLTSDNGNVNFQALKEAVIETIRDNDCPYNVDYSTIVCAVYSTGSTCNGDSGSYTGSYRNGRYEQDGIVSFGSAASCSGYPMGFTEVYKYLSWIDQTVVYYS